MATDPAPTPGTAPVAMSADVGMLALRARADLMDDILNRTDHGEVLHTFAHASQRHYEEAIAQLAGGHPVRLVVSGCGLAALLLGRQAPSSLLALTDIVSVLSGNPLTAPKASQ